MHSNTWNFLKCCVFNCSDCTVDNFDLSQLFHFAQCSKYTAFRWVRATSGIPLIEENNNIL